MHLRDPLPACLEPIHQLSGHEGGAYRECRLGETHLLIDRLEGWNDTFRYRCRVVTSGASLALPAHAECMYAPSVFGNSGAASFSVREKVKQ